MGKIDWDRYDDLATYLFFRLFVLGVVFAVIFQARVAPVDMDMVSDGSEKSVVLSSNEFQVIESSYNGSLEKRYCLYGKVNQDIVVVKDVVEDVDPISATNVSVRSDCITETVDRLPQLLLRSDYNFVGRAHTHPRSSTASLSKADVRTQSMWWMFRDIQGVYNGDMLEFYSIDEPGERMDSEVVG